MEEKCLTKENHLTQESDGDSADCLYWMFREICRYPEIFQLTENQEECVEVCLLFQDLESIQSRFNLQRLFDYLKFSYPYQNYKKAKQRF